MSARRVVLAVPAELAATVPARRTIYTVPGRWRCGKWNPPVEHTVREGRALCVGRQRRKRPGVLPHEWVVAAWFVGDDASAAFEALDARRGRALVLLDCPDVVLVHSETGAVL